MLSAHRPTLNYKIEMEGLEKVCSFSKRSYALLHSNKTAILKSCGLSLPISKRCLFDLEESVQQFVNRKDFTQIRYSACIPTETIIDSCNNVFLMNIPYGNQK